ncbi:hypothetical protein [Lignipirellula cremea]|uniref:Uncharacterized protein n=1 Tax=Lignipirellula cremea TaxID=2528010 RepID=A0A518E0C1_9BACT|nr:hypothetical protein [Lignipirellula cremea]QDU97532.1 hypothetical protein Pla8534_53800 [Lignipirellula cremea]
MISNWLRRRRRRRIYTFYEGTVRRRLDPLETLRLLGDDDEFRLNLHPALAALGDDEAIAICVRAARRALRLTYSGLTDPQTLALLDQYFEYLRRLKAQHQPAADMATAYGADVLALERTDYERFVGLWLNLSRAQLRQANCTRAGVEASLGVMLTGEPLPRRWFDAGSDTPAEAEHRYRTAR